MKKIFVALFLIISFNLFSEPIIFNYDFTIAYLPLETILQYTYANDLSKDSKLSFYSEFNAELLIYNLFFIGGDVRTNFFKEKSGNFFFPDMMTFKFFTGIRLSESIEFGFTHYCIHPLIPFLNSIEKPFIIWEGAYEEVYIKISGSTKK